MCDQYKSKPHHTNFVHVLQVSDKYFYRHLERFLSVPQKVTRILRIVTFIISWTTFLFVLQDNKKHRHKHDQTDITLWRNIYM